MSSCPCHSGKSYRQCCQPFHEGELPENALQLMRSRYSAYANGLVDYVLDTGPAGVSKEGVEQFCQMTSFLGLEILDFVDGDEEATVTFRAGLETEGQDRSFVEKSRFSKIDGRWKYMEGVVS